MESCLCRRCRCGYYLPIQDSLETVTVLKFLGDVNSVFSSNCYISAVQVNYLRCLFSPVFHFTLKNQLQKLGIHKELGSINFFKPVQPQDAIFFWSVSHDSHACLINAEVLVGVVYRVLYDLLQGL